MRIPAPRDWSEDFGHENGQYENVCHSCQYRFLGHKRRVTCRVCATAASAAPVAPATVTDEDVQRGIQLYYGPDDDAKRRYEVNPSWDLSAEKGRVQDCIRIAAVLTDFASRRTAPCRTCNDEGYAHTRDGVVLGPCDACDYGRGIAEGVRSVRKSTGLAHGDRK